jgi:hypothetical protein
MISEIEGLSNDQTSCPLLTLASNMAEQSVNKVSE